MTLTCPHCGKPIDYELKLLRSFNFNRTRAKLPKGKMQSAITPPEFIQGDMESPLDSRIIIPGARAGIIGGIALPISLWFLGWPAGPVVTVAGTLLLFAWLSKSPRVAEIETEDEAEATPKEIRLDITDKITKSVKFIDLAIQERDLLTVAIAIRDNRLSETQLTPRRNGFSQKGYKRAMDTLTEAGLIEYIDSTAPTVGRKPTELGQRVFSAIVDHPTPARLNWGMSLVSGGR